MLQQAIYMESLFMMRDTHDFKMCNSC